MPDHPISHLPRNVPPWEEVRQTRCGRPIGDVVRMGTMDAYNALVAREGKRRAAYDYCQTCTDQYVGGAGASWELNAIAIMADWLGRARYSQDGTRFEITASLHAISALIEAHHDEFQAHRDAKKGGAKSLDEARASKNMRHLRGLS